jgi:aminoglycoside phosphotransferase (APT) family kinase protein
MTAPVQSGDATTDRMADRLAAFVAREHGIARDAVQIRGLARLAGGASRELWSLQAVLADGTKCAPRVLDLVLRRDPPGRIGESDRALEFRLLRAAARAGVPVPAVLWCDPAGEVLGSPFFVMERVAGETLPRRLLRDAEFATARRVMTAELGRILARIHRIDPNDPDLAGLPVTPPDVSPARLDVERSAERARGLALEPHPVLELAERWLQERVPSGGRRTVVHGDYRIGNVMFGPEGTRAILDWELGHVGDPLEDLGWLCGRTWRFGSDALPAGGIGTREELCAAYEAESGTTVDREALRFWEAAGALRVAVVWLQQSRVFLDGKLRSVELAALGRRTAEAEDELLALMREGA